ncbi:hypothetical protein ACTJIJ_26020 [Niabella sp. 22666]|uniref:hypothetical protein n=1 Tax=Niabella sp. 22666 TaxID=3453954 RepID=UPI003F85DE3D
MPSTVYSETGAACSGVAREQHYFEVIALEASKYQRGFLADEYQFKLKRASKKHEKKDPDSRR